MIKPNNEFVYLISRFISFFGNSIILITVSIYMIDHNYSYFLLSLIFSINLLVSVFASPYIGHKLRNVDSKNAMVYSDIISGFICIIFTYLYFKNQNFIFLLLLFVLLAVLKSVFSISSNTYSTELYKNKLDHINSRKEVFDQVSLFLAPIIGIFIYSHIGFEALLYINAISFIISGIIEIFLVKSYKDFKSVELKFIKSLKLSINTIKNSRSLFQLLVIFIFYNIAISPIDEIYLPGIIFDTLDIQPIWLSLSLSLSIVGGIISSLCYTKITKNFKTPHYYMMILSILLSLCLIPLYIIILPFNLVAFNIILNASMFYLGFAGTIIGIMFITYIQKTVDSSHLSQFLGVLTTIMLFPLPITTQITGILVEKTSVSISMILTIIPSIIIILLLILGGDKHRKI